MSASHQQPNRMLLNLPRYPFKKSVAEFGLMISKKKEELSPLLKKLNQARYELNLVKLTTLHEDQS